MFIPIQTSATRRRLLLAVTVFGTVLWSPIAPSAHGQAALPPAAQTISGLPKAPSRAPGKGCTWEVAQNASIGLAAWVQRCNYGSRKIDLFFAGRSLVQRYSDGGAPDPLIDVIDMRAGESPRSAVARVYAAHSSATDRARCVLAPYRDGGPVAAGTERLAFVPNAAYARALAKQQHSTDIPDPPCGDWGAAPDGIQYFQVFPSSAVRRILFVRVGQDQPLFDELTLTLVQPAARR